MSGSMFIFVNGVASPTSAPPVSKLLESHPGAYTTFRTHNDGLEFLFWERHLRRLANSARILFYSCPKLLFQSGINSNSVALHQMKPLEWDSFIQSSVNDSMKKAIPCALKERRNETELAFTALVSGNLKKLIQNEKVGEEDIHRVFDMRLHVSLYAPLVFGVRTNGAHLAVVGNGRKTANAKYSNWVRMRKPLEKLRPPSATELLLSNDGDRILEGCLTNFFVLCHKDSLEEDNGCTEKKLVKSKYDHSIELQTAPISDGVLPGVIREVSMSENWNPDSRSCSIMVQASLVGRSIYYKYHVETIRVPSSWNSLGSKTWKDVMWEEKRFEIFILMTILFPIPGGSWEHNRVNP
ncbi:Aminotransferase, class IV, partial [Cynara cardunculus var. scolymus]